MSRRRNKPPFELVDENDDDAASHIRAFKALDEAVKCAKLAGEHTKSTLSVG